MIELDLIKAPNQSFKFKDFDITPEQFVVLVKLSEENGKSLLNEVSIIKPVL